LPKKLIAIFMQSTDFKSQFSMVAPWNVEDVVKMCVSKLVTTTWNLICLLLTWVVVTLCWVHNG
jgi:hypothetical protein